MNIAELVLFLGIAPLLVVLAPFKLPHIPLLVCAGFIAFVRVRPHVSFKRLLARPPRHWWHGPCIRAGALAVGATLYILLDNPKAFLSFPRDRPVMWGIVMLLYPVLSVLPQEIIFRVYIFEKFFSEPRQARLAILVSTALFSWVHIVYAGYFAMLATLVAGGVLGVGYSRSRGQPGALWAVLLEHSLYGMVIFTVGLGRYFFLARA
jgi:CAAX amino terminal protease family.